MPPVTASLETAEVSFGREAVHGYGVWPRTTRPLPGLVLIPDVRGLSEHYRDVARRFATEGFFTLAVDLYSREGAPDLPDMAAVFRWMRALPDLRVLADLGAAVNYLAGRTEVRRDAIGITGFCMGGRVSYLAACALPDKIKAAAPFYGGGIPIDRTATLQAPVLAFFGEDDAFIPLDQVRALEEEARRRGKALETVVYPKAPHGFFCDERDSYRPDAAADAWKRLTAFLAQHLKA